MITRATCLAFCLTLVPAATHSLAAQSRVTSEPTWRGRSLSEWTQDVADTSFAKRRAARLVLRRMGAPAHPAVPKLIPLLSNADPEIRANAADVIGGIALPSPAAATALISALNDPSREVRLQVVWALGRVGSASASAVASALGGALRDAVPWVADEAASSLVRLGTHGVPVLLKALQDPTPAVRERAVRALGRLGPVARPHLRAVTSLLEDPVPAVAENAAQAIPQIVRRGPPQAPRVAVVPPLPADHPRYNDEQAIRALIEENRLASFRSTPGSEAEEIADMAALDKISAVDYVRIGEDGSMPRITQGTNPVDVRLAGASDNGFPKDIQYEGVNIAFFGDMAVATYRSRYVTPEDETLYFRLLRVFMKRDGRWEQVTSIGVPLQYD